MPKTKKQKSFTKEEFAKAKETQREETGRTGQTINSAMRKKSQERAEETKQLQTRADKLQRAVSPKTPLKRSDSVKRAAPSEQNFAGVEGLMQSLKRNRETKLQLSEQLRQASERKRQATANSQSPAKAVTERKPSPKQSIATRRAMDDIEIDRKNREFSNISRNRYGSVYRRSPSVARYNDPDIERDARLYRQNNLHFALSSNPSAQRSPSVRANAGIQTEASKPEPLKPEPPKPQPVEEIVYPPSLWSGARSEDIPYLKEIWKNTPVEDRDTVASLYKKIDEWHSDSRTRGLMKDEFYRAFAKNENIPHPGALLLHIGATDYKNLRSVWTRAQERGHEPSKDYLPVYLKESSSDVRYLDNFTKIWHATPKEDRGIIAKMYKDFSSMRSSIEQKYIHNQDAKYDVETYLRLSKDDRDQLNAAWKRPRLEPKPEPKPEPVVEAKPEVPEPSFEERVQAEVQRQINIHFGKQLEDHRDEFAQRLRDFDSRDAKLVKQNRKLENEINEYKLRFGKQLADAEDLQTKALARADKLERSLKKRKASSERRRTEMSDLRKGVDERFDSQSEEFNSLRRRMDNSDLRRKESTKRRQDEISEIRTRMDNSDQQSSKRQKRLEQSLASQNKTLAQQTEAVASLQNRMDENDRHREAQRQEEARRVEAQKNIARRRVMVNTALGDIHFVDVNNPGMQIEIGNAMMRGSRRRFYRNERGERRLIPSGNSSSNGVSDIFLAMLNSQKR